MNSASQATCDHLHVSSSRITPNVGAPCVLSPTCQCPPFHGCGSLRQFPRPPAVRHCGPAAATEKAQPQGRWNRLSFIWTSNLFREHRAPLPSPGSLPHVPSLGNTQGTMTCVSGVLGPFLAQHTPSVPCAKEGRGVRRWGAWKIWIRTVHALTIASTATCPGLRPGGGLQWRGGFIVGSRLPLQEAPHLSSGAPGLLLTHSSEGMTLR